MSRPPLGPWPPSARAVQAVFESCGAGPYAHLSDIFAKLGVSSRTETAAAVIRGHLPAHLAGG
jgi:hypothetical protein